jgi:hypothetical protein
MTPVINVHGQLRFKNPSCPEEHSINNLMKSESPPEVIDARMPDANHTLKDLLLCKLSKTSLLDLRDL